MSIELRVLLFVGSVGTFLYFLNSIRQNKLQIGYAVSWSVLSIFLIVLSIFPQIVEWAADVFRVQSPANLIYLLIIFILLIQQFLTTMRLSKLNQQITRLTQYIALKEEKEERTEEP